MKDFLNKNSKHIIIAVAVIVAAFILKPERSAFEDCYYENKKFEVRNDKSSIARAIGSAEAIDNCRD